MKNKSFFLVILLFSLKFSFAQKDFKSAEKAIQQGHFFDALEDYKKAYNESKKEDQKPFISFKVGECYRLMNDYKQAEEWYAKAVKANYTDPKALFYLGEAKKAQGKYAEALVDFTSYLTASPTDKGAQDAVKSCELAQKWKDKPTRYKVESVTTINTAENDFFPTYADKKYNKLYFISTRTGVIGKSPDPANGKLCGDIFDAQMEKTGNFSAVVPLPEPINTKEIEGGCLVTKKADMLFFSRSADKTNSQLWFSSKVGLIWGEPEKINFCVETSTYLAPSISDDGMTLLFASNLPEGQGDYDIWISKYDKATKKWGAPTNLGPDINTPENDNYPFIHDDGSLYFSSTGRLGMGALDIYKAEYKGEDKWANVTNLKYPINSAGDDFGIIFEGNKEKGYLSSNREGSKGGLDIWSFVEPPLIFMIEGVVTDCISKETIEGASVKLTGSDGISAVVKTDVTGSYKFAESSTGRHVNANTSYIISVVDDASLITPKAPGGFSRCETVAKQTTVGIDENKNYKNDFCLTPKPPEPPPIEGAPEAK